MDEYVGIVKLFAGGAYAPQGWMFCQGQSLSVENFQALFSVIGYMYGGKGSDFNLPDLRGNVPVGAGQSGGSNYLLGKTGGNASVNLLAQQMPLHTHAANVAVSSANATGSAAKAGQNLGAPGNSEGGSFNATFGYVQGAANIQLASNSVTVGLAGGGQPIDIRQPYLAMNYIIYYDGISPNP